MRVERETDRNNGRTFERNSVRVDGRGRQVPLIKHTSNEVGVWKNGPGFRKRCDQGSTSFQNGEGKSYKKGLTSYFFTNFPNKFGNERMWKIFLKWGDDRDVYIPQRRYAMTIGGIIS